VRVLARVAYPSWDFHAQPWRDQDFDAHFFVHAVKNDREKIGNRVANLPMGVGGTNVRIDHDNLDVPQKFFARWAASRARLRGITDPVFVGIPNRNALTEGKPFNVGKLARMAAQAFGEGGSAFTGLRFREFVPKEAGKRQSVRELVENMVLISEPPNGTYVLVDDVFTLGKHLTAAIKVLPKRKSAVAVVAGKTEKAPLEDMTTVPVHSHWCIG
jgi:hypothetical protein